MNNHIKEYIESIESHNTQKVVQHVFKKVDVDNIEKCNLIQLEQLIINTKPSSPKEIITTIYILSSYIKWMHERDIIKDDNLYQLIQSLDKEVLWEKCKHTAKKKFISFAQYQDIIKDIATYEEYNALYFELLFACIYSGIYNDDMSVLKNLRGKDINENGIVTLREDDGHVYKIRVSERLARDLIQLSTVDEWIRPNRFGLCYINMKGVYPDSIFKVENRSTNSENSYKFSYYSKLRKISKEYIGYPLLPLQLYVSGIMYRIKGELKKNNLSLEEAFGKNNRNKIVHMIIEKELTRCNNNIEIGNFRELVKGHLDLF